jgi:toxin-antitoxin system PIN domain toxin
MTYLLDVNVLIALLDRRHVHNEVVQRWVSKQGKPFRWATSPLVENAFVRILGNSTYPNSLGSATAALTALRKTCTENDHHFWPDDLTLRDGSLWMDEEFPTPSQITDCYLLALAVMHGGKLVSLDQKLPARLIQGGRKALGLINPLG